MSIHSNRISRHTSHKNKGMSLVEVMVTMLIGIFLILGLVNIFASNKDSHKFETEIAEMDANARSALFVLRKSISHAGYPSQNFVALEKGFLTPSAADTFINPTCRDDKLLISSSLDSTSYLADSSSDGLRDIITPIFMIDNPESSDGSSKISTFTGCLGLNDDKAKACSTDPIHGMIDQTQARNYNRFYISTRDAQRTLICMGINGAQPIAENIENMQILYGVTSNDTIAYMNATKLQTYESEGINYWPNIRSVQIALLVRSERDLAANATAKQFTLLDKTINISSDKRFYKVYTTTISLENQSYKTL